MEGKNRLGWVKLAVYLLLGTRYCVLTFSRTENVALRISVVIGLAAMMIGWFTTEFSWSTDRHLRSYRVLAAALFVCGGVHVWLGTHPPTTWFFGLTGIALILNGFLFALFSSKEYVAGNKLERSGKV